MSKRQAISTILNLIVISFLASKIDWDINAAKAAFIGLLAAGELIIVGLAVYERRY
ncbi:MAG: hypothetical protein LBO03_07770 [Acidaminococcales bacterium]|jgi:hypothetical protein|nr:hypothetical protein [Acidaminococcales bacterium]